jgi:hypothetical protein
VLLSSFSFLGRDVVLHARLDRFDKPAGARQGSDVITKSVSQRCVVSRVTMPLLDRRDAV